MDSKQVAAFFNQYAADWDKNMIRNDAVINEILDNTGVTEGRSVLDVACGTGVLIPDYLKRRTGQITAIDIAQKMIDIARSKFDERDVTFECADAETYHEGIYDCIVIYNAFPHFDDQEKLIANLAELLKPEGRLTVAHGMSREQINICHRGSAADISHDLIDVEELAAMFGRYLDVSVVISDDRMYQVVGIKR